MTGELVNHSAAASEGGARELGPLRAEPEQTARGLGMRMTDEHWDAVEQLLSLGWDGPKQPWSIAKASAYRKVLERYELAAVELAIARLMEAGSDMRPGIAQVVAAINADPDRPAWSEAYQAFYGPRGALRLRDDTAALERLDHEHPLIGLFARAEGLERLRRNRLNDPEWGARAHELLERRWNQFVERYDERRRNGLALEALGRPARGELKRLDPLAALKPVARPELAAVPDDGQAVA